MVRYIIIASMFFLALSTAQADQVLVCTSDTNLPASTLLIKGAPEKPSQIVWPGWGNTARSLVITAASEADYTAVEQEPKSESPSGKLYVDRLSGQLTLENYISQEARRILVKLCDRQISEESCKAARRS
jgi:hypothetical protein